MAVLSYPGELVRRYDHDRFMTAIFAPDAAREGLFALYAFNIEIAKTAEIVSETLIGQMRLQWWRDTLDRLYAGDSVAHGVAVPLGAAIRAKALDRARFDRLIEAREADLEKQAPADTAALLAYAEDSAAPLLALAMQLLASGSEPLSAECEEAARLVGSAWALIGLLRAAPFHARQRRVYLPADLMAAEGVAPGRLFDFKPEPGLSRVVVTVAALAESRLTMARTLTSRVPRPMRSPLLIASLGSIHLSSLRKAGWNPFLLPSQAPPLAIARLAMRALLGRY